MTKSIFTPPKVVKYDDLNKAWYVYFYYNGKQYRVKGGINYHKSYNQREREANQLKDACHLMLKQGRNPAVRDVVCNSEMTLLQSLDFSLEKKKDNIAPKSYLGYKSTVGFIKTAIFNLGLQYLNVTDTKRVHIKTILEQAKKDRSATNNAYNKYLDHFRAVLSELLQWDIIEFNPANKIDYKPVGVSRANVTATDEQHQIIKEQNQKRITKSSTRTFTHSIIHRLFSRSEFYCLGDASRMRS